MAVCCGRGEVALTLITEFGCDANLLNNDGYTILHRACEYGHASVVRMVGKYASVLATRDGDTPLHIAAARGHNECVEALLQLDAPTSLKNAAGKTALHIACERGHASIVKIIGKSASLLATSKDGDTPLHIAAAMGHNKCVEALLQLDAPILLRNAAGKTARDIARYGAEQLLDAYITQNKTKLYAHYDIVMQQAKKKYSNAERITRVFVIDNPGAGKSSFVEAMKREGFFESFGRVSESTVPLELHDVGILFVIGDERGDNPQVILNILKLTNEVHKLLFSKESEFLETEEAISSFNIGILPQSLLNKLLPQHITKECLIQLQYCQEISQHDLIAFPSQSKPCTSSQSFLFFPALCIVGKSDVSWVTPPGLGYSIGWLARCAGTSCDYFPPRFLHVLLLRLIFRFTLEVPAQQQTDTGASPDPSHLKRCCTMWNCGVHWSMVQGVDCMVELVNGNKGVVVLTSSIHKAKQNCIDVFKRVVSCVMEAKEDFCHSFQPQFFHFDPSQSADYLNEDGLFAMSDVKSVLSLPPHEGQVVLSVNGMFRERIACLSKCTLWNSLFSLDVASVNHYLKDV